MQEKEIIAELKGTAEALDKSEKRIREIGINFLKKQQINLDLREVANDTRRKRTTNQQV